MSATTAEALTRADLRAIHERLTTRLRVLIDFTCPSRGRIPTTALWEALAEMNRLEEVADRLGLDLVQPFGEPGVLVCSTNAYEIADALGRVGVDAGHDARTRAYLRPNHDVAVRTRDGRLLRVIPWLTLRRALGRDLRDTRTGAVARPVSTTRGVTQRGASRSRSARRTPRSRRTATSRDDGSGGGEGGAGLDEPAVTLEVVPLHTEGAR